VTVLPTPANSFAFQATTTTSSSLSVRPPIQVAATFARQLSLSSSQHSRSHYQNGKIVLAMSSDAAAIDAASNANEASNGGGTASIPNEVFNLVKSIVGAGVLSLPAGEFWDITIIDIFFIESHSYYFMSCRLSLSPLLLEFSPT
jgi:hypothetical protein